LIRPHPGSHITTHDLFASVSKLKKLKTLHLPAVGETFRDASGLWDPDDVTWPVGLKSLRLSGFVPYSRARKGEEGPRWNLPAHLKELTIYQCSDFSILTSNSANGIQYPQVRSLSVHNLRSYHLRYCAFTICEWIKVFPNLDFLSLPATAIDGLSLVPTPTTPVLDQARLECLEITSGSHESKNFQTQRLLGAWIWRLPSVWKLQLDESFTNFDDVLAECQDLDVVLKDRAKARNGDDHGGVTGRPATVIDLEEAGVTFI